MLAILLGGVSVRRCLLGLELLAKVITFIVPLARDRGTATTEAHSKAVIEKA